MVESTPCRARTSLTVPALKKSLPDLPLISSMAQAKRWVSGDSNCPARTREATSAAKTLKIAVMSLRSFGLRPQRRSGDGDQQAEKD